MKLTTRVTSPVGLGRRVPTWASQLIAVLSRDSPLVVTREDMVEWLAEVGSDREVEACVSELRRLGWLVGLPIQGTWAFIPPGQDGIADPYLALRAWQARDNEAEFMLAGETAAWHLGYLDRQPEGRTRIWLLSGRRLPDGLRRQVSVVRINWRQDMMNRLGPLHSLLLRHRLDIVNWASGLPAFGPEALIVQLAAHPSSFRPWADLVGHLDQLTTDCEDERLTELLSEQSASAWQRSAYLLHVGGHPQRAAALLQRKPGQSMPKVRFEHPDISYRSVNAGVWSSKYHLIDRLIAPLQNSVGKA